MSATTTRHPLDRFDDALFRVEKTVVAGMLAVMGVMVFLDVVHRVSTSTGSWFGNPLVIAGASAGLGVLAFRTRGDASAVPKGLGLGIAVAAAQAVLVWLLPNGLVWSQTFALALTLWLGCIGASLAAHDRRHLALDIGSKLWSPEVAPKVAAAGHVVTALFCLIVFGLGWMSVREHLDLWVSTDGAAGNLSGLGIPKWFPALAIPYGMGVLTFRFAREAWKVGTGQISAEVDELAALGIQVETQPPHVAEGPR